MNLNMYGGNVPPTPTQQTGDGFRREEAYGFNERQEIEKKLKLDNEVVIALSWWLINKN